METRDELLAEANSEGGLALAASFREPTKLLDDETLAPRDGLRFADHTLVSAPDGNTSSTDSCCATASLPAAGR